MPILSTRDERVFVQVTHPYAPEVPNSTGAATVANGDAVRHIRAQLGGFGGQVIITQAKTGSKGRLAGVEGRSGGERWSLELPFQMSGAAGTPPDMGPVLEAIFGQAPTVNAGVSVVYSLSDSIPGLAIWSFRTAGGSASNVAQRVAWGALADEFEIATGDGELVMTVSGTCSFVLPSIGFASFTATQKGELSAFPSEPGSPTYNGNIIPAFIGSATINGVTTFLIESFSIRGRLNRALRYAFGSRIPTVPVGGAREITLTFRLYEENAAALNALRDLQRSKTPFDISLVFGDTAGYIATFALNNVVLPSESVEETGEEYTIGFADVPASMTDSVTRDELSLTLS
jgi:hypothetical protein